MTPVTPLGEAQKKFGTRAMALAIVVGLVFLVAGHKAICRGLVMGALFSTINFVLMAQMLPRRMGLERARASLAALGGIVFRYAIMAVPLFVAITFARFDLLATIVGLFMVQLVILADHVTRHVRFAWRK